MKYTPVGVSGGVRASVGGLGRYIQYRDNKRPDERVRDIDGLTRYVAYRDRASPEGRLFDARGTIGDAERREFTRYVTRSVAKETKSFRHGNQAAGRQRACYRFVLSPADSRGVDLRELTRKTMEQLAEDVGTKNIQWIAAEHRNTAHPHVHVIAAAKRETSPGRYRTMQVTKARLLRMKAAVDREMTRQRGAQRLGREQLGRRLIRSSHELVRRPTTTDTQQRNQEAMDDLRAALGLRPRPHSRGREHRPGIAFAVQRIAFRLSRYYQREMLKALEERMARRDDEEEQPRVRRISRGRGS